MPAYTPVNSPKELRGLYDLRGSYRLVTSTGAVTVIAAGTATAGHIFSFRWSSSTSTKAFIKFVGARFILTTAYGTAQETGCDMFLARSYSASHTGGTAIDVGSTVTDTGKLHQGFATSLVVANACRVAGAGALTAGTHTLDANPIGILSDWSSGIGATVPTTSSGSRSGYGTLFDSGAMANGASGHGMPIRLTQNEGFVIRNLVLMGATGVGRWDFLVEWDEGVPVP